MNDIMTYQGGAPAAQNSTTAEMMVSRQAQEVQAAMVVAKRFPRDETASWSRIMQSCQRRSLAEQAMYEYPRGGENVTGPSIRLAETLAQNWGNLDFGVVELEQKPGESTVMSYCWDLETNTRQTKIFTVPHIRQTKKGAKVLTDPRDIYEMVANQGARRLRACILGIIPGDVVDAAVDKCNETLRGGKEPLVDRVRKMVSTFQDKLSVPQECLEQYIGCKAEAFTEQSIVRLRGVFTAIKEGRASREEYFTLPSVSQQEAAGADNGPVDMSVKKQENPVSGDQEDDSAYNDVETVSINDL